jgi:hypothetical protein
MVKQSVLGGGEKTRAQAQSILDALDKAGFAVVAKF